ncbi:MAG: metallophosphoesterase [Verrucomicrobia bacterium]|nr:metallophosphoesterase [Verrucomicrobiota bacterium]
MRYFILSDVHANREALQAVLEDMKLFQPRFRGSVSNASLAHEDHEPTPCPLPGGELASAHRLDSSPPGRGEGVGESMESGSRATADALVNLGDTIGYMPHPNEVMDILWPVCDLILPGNHDLEVAHLFHASEQEARLLRARYNEQAAWSLEWTKRALAPRNLDRLTALSQRQRFLFRKDHLLFAHASPVLPERMYYIDGTMAARELFFSHQQFDGTIAFVGHIHVPQLYIREPKGILGGRLRFEPPKVAPSGPIEKRWPVKKGETVLVVVPSVGQPRDGLYYAGYAVYDDSTEELIMRRVPYDVIVTQSEMRALDFPPKLWGRLARGI